MTKGLKRLAIITTHPIQYNAPWFRILSERKNIAIKVFYTWSQVEHEEKFDPGFGKNISWDIPLLDGYDYAFVNNTSVNPGSKTYKGIQNPSLNAEIEIWGADAVLIYGWKFKSHLNAIRHFHNRIPVLFRGDSHLLGRKCFVKNFLRTFLLRRVFRNVDYSLYVGSLNKDYFTSAGMKEEQLIYCPHTIDHELFKSSDETIKAGHEYRDSLHISKDALVFLYAGKFEEVKNPLLLLQAASKIKNKDVYFVFVGNGPLEDELRKQAGDQVRFMNFQNQKAMPGLFEMGDIYVLPSRSETWALAVNEAMACGKPVLISNTCGCAPDLVTEGITGFTFRQGDEQSLIQKIELVIQNRDILKEMGNEARIKVRKFTLEQNAETLENLVRKI